MGSNYLDKTPPTGYVIYHVCFAKKIFICQLFCMSAFNGNQITIFKKMYHTTTNTIHNKITRIDLNSKAQIVAPIERP